MDGGMGGPTGSGKPSAPAARLVQCDETAIVSDRPPSGRLLGLIPLLFGVFPLMMGLGLFTAGDGDRSGGPGSLVAGLICLAFGLPFLLVGYSFLGPTLLRIDPTTRRYQLRDGCWPLRKDQEGGREDFTHLSLHVYDNSLAGTTLQLHWRDPKRQPFALFTGSRETARHLGKTIAGRLGIAFRESWVSADHAYSPPATQAYVTHCDERAVVSERRWEGTRSLSTFLLVFGLAVMAIGIVTNRQFGSAWQPGIDLYSGFLLISGLLCTLGGFAGMGPSTFVIDVARQTYREKRGWPPLVRSKQGDTAEFNRLALWPYDGGKRGMALVLYWRDWNRTPLVLHTASHGREASVNREEAREQGLTVVKVLHLPFVDEAGMSLCLESSNPAPTPAALFHAVSSDR